MATPSPLVRAQWPAPRPAALRTTQRCNHRGRIPCSKRAGTGLQVKGGQLVQCVLGAPSGAQEGLRRARRRGRRAGGGAEALPNSERPAHFPPMLFRQLDRDMCHSYLNKPSAPWAARPAALPPPPPPQPLARPPSHQTCMDCCTRNVARGGRRRPPPLAASPVSLTTPRSG